MKVPSIEVGARYDRWTVTRVARDQVQIEGECCYVTCDCGRTGVVRPGDLRHGKTRSCGCLRMEVAARIAKTRRPKRKRSDEVDVPNPRRKADPVEVYEAQIRRSNRID